MNHSIKDYSFLLLEEIPLCELSQGLEEVLSDYRSEGEESKSMAETLEILEREFSEEISQWIQTNQELSSLLSEE
jgi:hypothetical protein